MFRQQAARNSKKCKKQLRRTTLDGNRRQGGEIMTTEKDNSSVPSPKDYQYGDEIFAESGKKSRGGLSSLNELRTAGVQKVGGEILSPTSKSKVTLAIDSFTFNAACVQLFPETQYVEFVIDKPNKRLIVFPSDAVQKDSVKFALLKNEKNKPRKTNARKFCALLFNFMEWSAECRYRVMAIYQKLDGQELLVFNLDEAVEVQATTIVSDDGKTKTVREYLLPVKFRESFGDEYAETERGRQVNLDDMFMFIDPKTGQTQQRTIVPHLPNAEEITRSNYRNEPSDKPINSNGGVNDA